MPEASDSPEPDQSKSLRRSWQTSGALAKFTAVGAGIAALAAALCAIAAFWRLSETRAYFRHDLRPYVFSTDADPAQLAPAPGQYLVTRVSYRNYGKSPALQVRAVGDIFCGSRAAQQAEDWFSRMGETFPSQPLPPQDVLMPGDAPTYKPTNGSATCESASVPYVIVGRVQYFDNDGTRYWSDICWWHPDADPQAPTTRCANHNEIH